MDKRNDSSVRISVLYGQFVSSPDEVVQNNDVQIIIILNTREYVT
jgi:hypothetical protein